MGKLSGKTALVTNYIQHSAHIAPGRDGLFNLVKSLPSTLKYEPGKDEATAQQSKSGAPMFGKSFRAKCPVTSE